MERNQVEWTGLGVAFPSILGNPKDPESPLARYLRDMAEQGHIVAREIPQELQYK